MAVDTMTTTTTSSNPTTPLSFEPNTIYILLLDRGDSYNFHWTLFLTQTHTTGTTYHITNDAGPTSWKYETTTTKEIPQLRRLLVALKLGSLETVLHQALSDRLALVPLCWGAMRVNRGFTCRSWVLEALFVLDDEGYVDLSGGGGSGGAGTTTSTSSIRGICDEAQYLAMIQKSKCERGVMRSRARVS